MAEAVFRVRPELAGIETLRTRMTAALRGVRVPLQKLNVEAAKVRLQLAQGLIPRAVARRNIAELNLARTQLRGIGQQMRGIRSTLTGTLTKLVAFAGVALIVRKIARELFSAARAGIDLNKQFESMQVGVAATLAGNTRLVTVQGKQLKGLQAVVAAQGLSRNIQRDIFNIALKTGGTIDDTLGAFRIALPLIFEDIRRGGRNASVALGETLQVVERLNLAAIAIGVPAELVRIQIDDLLKGVVTTRTLLAKIIGVRQEELRIMREQGKIVEFLLGKLQPFADAQSLLISKFASASNRARALAQIVQLELSQRAFGSLRGALNKIIRQFAVFDTATGNFLGFTPQLQSAIDTASGSIGRIADQIARVTENGALLKFTRDSISLLGDAAESVVSGIERINVRDLVRNFVTDLRNAFRGAAVGGIAGGIIGALGGPVGIAAGALGGLFVGAFIRKIKIGLENIGARIGIPEDLLRQSIRISEALDAATLFQIGNLRGGRPGAVAGRLRTDIAGLRIFQLKVFQRDVSAASEKFEKLFEQLSGAKTKEGIVSLIVKLKELRESLDPDVSAAAERAALSLQSLAGQAEPLKLVIEKFAKIPSLLRPGEKSIQQLIEETKRLGITIEKLPNIADQLGLARAENFGRRPSLLRDSERVLMKVEKLVGESFSALADDIGSSFARIFEEVIARSRSFSSALKSIFRNLAGSIVAQLLRRVFTNIFNRLFDTLKKAVAAVIAGKGGILARVLRIVFNIPNLKQNITTAKVDIKKSEKTTINAAVVNVQGGGGGPNPFLPFSGGGGIGRILGRLPGRKLTGAAGAAQGISGLVGPALLLSSLTKGGRLGTAAGIAGGALTGFAFGGPIGAGIGAVAGGFLAGILGAARRREARRLKLVEAAIKRQMASLPERKAFQFANAPTIQGILSSTFLRRPGGSFLPVPRAAGFPTGTPAQTVVVSPQITFQVQALDSEDVERFFHREAPQIARAMRSEIEKTVVDGMFRSGKLPNSILEITNLP